MPGRTGDCTAAPTYFEPQSLEVSADDGTIVRGAFVDGGVSPFNDPALQLLMLAVLDGYGFRWLPGRDNLLLISLGTGTYKHTFTPDELEKMVAAEQSLRALESVLNDCERVNQSVLQWLTNSITPWEIDRALGKMESDSKRGPQLATYARYNALLEPGWMRTEVAIERSADRMEKIASMFDPTNMDELAEIGRIVAAKQVMPEHFAPVFDVE
jgi:hypothetical protein